MSYIEGSEPQQERLTPDLLVDHFNDLPPVVRDFERKFALMHLIARIGGISRTEVEALADQLYVDSQNSVHRPLSEVWNAVLAEEQKKEIPSHSLHKAIPKRDPVLTRVAVSYTIKEMDRQYSLFPASPDEPPRGLVDTIAGSGHPRPILEELYSLAGVGLLSVDKLGTQDERFQVTDRGKELSNENTIIFRHLPRGGQNNLVVADSLGAKPCNSTT